MLFSYTVVPHQMEKMQEIIDFIFHRVWCNAHTMEYGIHLFQSFEPLHHIMTELYRRDLSDTLMDGAGKWFYQAVNEIFNEFKKLSTVEIDEYCRCYQANNSIEALCSNLPENSPVQYGDLNPSKTDLNSRLSNFYKNLYSSGFFGLAFVKEALGSDLNTYYDDFIRINNSGCCPFCGLLPMDNQFDPTREAFDHYLPKSRYPFNSVNLKNLAPSCNKCNSGNKGEKDPLHGKRGDRRKAFYPFSRATAGVQVSVDIHIKDWENPAPADFTISISSASHAEEVETWNDLFQIKDRYRAKCCDSGGGSYWWTRVLEENENYEHSIREILETEIKIAGSHPYAESNFLKRAFLEGCKRAGLFNVISAEKAEARAEDNFDQMMKQIKIETDDKK